MRAVGLGGLLLGLLGLSPLGAQAPDLKQVEKQFGRPVLAVPRPQQPPAIDGQIDDACWSAATPVTLMHSTGAWWEPPSQKTEARVLADPQAIYFAVRCFESEPERIVAGGKPRGGMVVGADTVEFFLDPGHRQRRFDYFHVIVTPDGSVHLGKGLEPAGWAGPVSARVGRFDGGWTVEAAVPLAGLGLKPGAIPRLWGLNICRQRPELACDMPKAARDAGKNRFDPSQWKLDQADKYRLAEYTCWSPTMAEFCGWPFYSDSRPFHFVQRFGHAWLEVGAQDVPAPGRRFEVLFRSEFDRGQLGPFQNAALVDEAFRGSGKSIGFAEGQSLIRLTQALEDLEDVTLLFTLKMPNTEDRPSPMWNKGPIPLQRLMVFGEAPDGRRCGAERYEIFLSPEAAQARTRMLEQAHRAQFGAGTFELYDTHADMVRWKPCGRVRPGPGPWSMVEGYFAEPSPGQVRWPGKDWVIVRMRLGQFRRTPGPNQGQRLVPRDQGYPKGLLFQAQPREGVRLGDFVIFRGDDDEPPAQVRGIKVQRQAEQLDLSWERSADNTLTAFYRVYSGPRLAAETHQLAIRLPASAASEPISIVACDLYGNTSLPSEPVPLPK